MRAIDHQVWLLLLLLHTCFSNQLRGGNPSNIIINERNQDENWPRNFYTALVFDKSIDNTLSSAKEIVATVAPTEEPSEFLSFPKFADFTSAPTSKPSKVSAFNSVPSLSPSTEPIESPTTMFPTSQPSRNPSLDPSEQPSAQPTGRPTCEPSFQPSHPSLSSQPSGKPSCQPSSSPSMQPSAMPSLQPNGMPSCVPSAQPSRSPSSQPSHRPSSEPSLQPNGRPTAQPSSIPSSRTVGPTPLPSTIRLTPIPSQLLVGQCASTNSTLAIASYLNATTFNFAYIEPGFMNFTKSMYLHGIVNVTRTMQNLLVSNSPVSVTYLALEAACSENGRSLYFNEQQVTCNDEQSVDFIWRSMMSARSFQTTCQGENWLAMYCPNEGLYRVCANCTQADHCQNTGVNTAQRADLVGFALKPCALIWPQWEQMIINSSFDRVVVGYNLSTSGTLTCAAVVESSNAITTLAAISLSSNAQTDVTSEDNTRGVLTLSKLRPDTPYEILCYSQSNDFNSKAYSTPTINDVYGHASYIRTEAAPLPVVVLRVPFVELVKDQISSAISVSLSFQPGKNISVTPVAEYVSSALCSGQSVVSGDLVATNITVAPSKLSFPAYGSVTKKLFLQATLVGCYRLRFEVSSGAVNGSSLALTLSDGGDAYYYNCTDYPSVPVVTISSIVYASTGVSVNLIFSSAIDLTADSRFAMNFVCDLLLNFTHAAECTCAFISATKLNIVLGGSALLMPGDMVLVLASRLKPQCPVGFTYIGFGYIGALYGTVQNTVSVPVKASISTASVVQLYGNITLDLSESYGRGASGFVVSWKVLHNGTYDTYAHRIQQRMNSGTMSWFGCVPMTFNCDTVPAQYLNTSGVYSFTVTLTNFLGYSSSASAVVVVQSSSYIPNVRILGSSLSTVSASSTVTLRAIVNIDSSRCAGQRVEITWVTYVNEESIPLNNYANDPRSLVLVQNSLTPNQLYTFQVNVFCGGNVAYAQAQRYVTASTPQIALVNDESTSVAASSPLTLNASLLASYNVYGASDFVVEWSCVQLQPLNEAGCWLFYQYMNLTQPLNLFAVVGDVLQPASEYYVSVQVSSKSLGVAITSGQRIEILPTVSTGDKTVISSLNHLNSGNNVTDYTADSLPVVSVVSTTLVAAANFGYTVNAIVSSYGMYAVFWQIVNTNTTLSSAIFIGTGSQYFPAVISSTLAITASEAPMTLQLSAFKITSSCNQLSCVDSASVVSVSFPVTINQGPSGGLISTDPAFGNKETIFSIFASSWQDTDLPMYYSFYQAQSGENGGWSLIRQKMQASFLTSQLFVAGNISYNMSIPLQVRVADVLGAESFAETRVIWQSMIEKVSAYNITTAMVASTIAAAITAAEIITPELILPYMAGMFSTLAEFSCFSTTNNNQDCIDLVQAASVALLPSLDQFNNNAVILLGIAQYLNAFVSVLLASSSLQARSWDALSPLLEAYVYLTNNIVNVDLSHNDATDILATLLSTSEALASQFQLLMSNEREDLMSNVTSSLVALRRGVISASQAYFSLLPYGNSIVFNSSQQSSQLFNVSFVKSYGYSGSSTGLQFSNEIFPSDGSTASYQLLQVNDLLTVGDCIVESNATSKNISCAIIAGSVFIQFQLFSNYFKSGTLLYLPFAVHPNSYSGLVSVTNDEFLTSKVLMSAASNATVIIVNCSDAQALLSAVTCTEEMTGGDAYIFPPLINCPVNTSAVNFTCPLFNNEIGCFQDGSQVSIATSIGYDSLKVNCSYPMFTVEDQTRVRLRRKLQSSSSQPATSIVSSIDIESSFSVGKITRLVSSPFTSLTPAIPRETISKPVTDNGLQSQQPAIPLYAVGIIIFFAGVIFFTVMNYKLKEFVEQNPIMGQVPQTQADIVLMPPVTDAYLAIDNGTESASASSSSSSVDDNHNSNGDEEEAGIRSAALVNIPIASLNDVQVIEIHAVALPLGNVRRSRF